MLIERLQARGDMPFVEYMQTVLYSPAVGYYSSDKPKFGAAGDFVTAPEQSPLFGGCLAHQCQQVLSALGHGKICEFGAGSGALCIDVLLELERLRCLPEKYYIIELSAGLKALQKASIQQAIPHLFDKVEWLTTLPTQFSGVVLANEVLDAMPVHRFLLSDEGALESWVHCDANGGLSESYQPIQDARLAAYIHAHCAHLPKPYQSEVNLYAGPWIHALADMIEKAVVLLVDYGFPRAEYYHADRRLGTLMCHHQHKSHPDPLRHPGEQDITAHVDFTHVAEQADAVGFHVAGFCNQASFLLGNGLLSLLDDHASDQDDYRQKQAVKLLTHPQEMGELFKVMALSKGLDMDLQGFAFSDQRGRL